MQANACVCTTQENFCSVTQNWDGLDQWGGMLYSTVNPTCADYPSAKIRKADVDNPTESTGKTRTGSSESTAIKLRIIGKIRTLGLSSGLAHLKNLKESIHWRIEPRT